MTTVIILGTFAVVLAGTEKIFQFRHGLKLSFILIFLLTALRYNYGTDYPGYYADFTDIGTYASIADINIYMFLSEKWWLILNYLFQPLGFFVFMIFIAVFICYTYYAFIKKYVDPKYYWFAVFVYVFCFDIMWIQFSAIRQAVAIAIFINSIKYLDDKKNPILYVLFNAVAGMIHSSAFFMLPFVLFCFDRLKRSKLIGLSIYAIFWILLVWGEYLVPQMRFMTKLFAGERYLSRYDYAYLIAGSTTWIGIIIWGMSLTAILYYVLYQEQNKKFLFYFCSMYFLIYVLNPLVWLSPRMGYYFVPFCIIVYPLIMQSEKNTLIKIGVSMVFTILIINQLFNFMELDWVIRGYERYQTIFSVL